MVFKPQGQETDSGSPLLKDDFMIGIQTPFQLEMLKLVAGNIVCMDATHDTNHYNFKLVTY